jgi:hypothetical protein
MGSSIRLNHLAVMLKRQRKFKYTYHKALLRLFKAYCAFLRLEDIPYYQIFAYLSEPKYLDKYLKIGFPDEEFKKIFKQAIQKENMNKMMECYEQLSQYVLNQMGGFEINGWKLHSSIEI